MRKLHMPYIQITSAAYHIYASEGPKGLTTRRVGAAVGVQAAAAAEARREPRGGPG